VLVLVLQPDTALPYALCWWMMKLFKLKHAWTRVNHKLSWLVSWKNRVWYCDFS
jgi:hypothetical protein